MPSTPLTDAAIRAAMREVERGGKAATLRDPGRRGEGRLILSIRAMPSGALAEWYAQAIHGGRRTLAKLGTYPGLSLSAARAEFRTLSPAIREGHRPATVLHLRRRERLEAGTVAELFAGYVEQLRAAGRRSAYAASRALLEGKGNAADALGRNRAARDVTPQDVADWLRPIWQRGAHAMCARAREFAASAFAWGLASEADYRTAAAVRWGLTSNPAAAVPVAAEGRRAGERALSPGELRRAWNWLDTEAGRTERRACACLLLQMATGQRLEEIARLRAEDVRDGWAFWPTTKTGRPHAIPLPSQAVDLLAALEPNRHGLYFYGTKWPERPMPYNTLWQLARRCTEALQMPSWSPRDLRRTWRSLAGGEAGLSAEECARLQNHAYGPPIAERHYNRGTYEELKRGAMARWEAWLSGNIAGVLP